LPLLLTLLRKDLESVEGTAVPSDADSHRQETTMPSDDLRLELRPRRRRSSRIAAEALVLGALIAFGWFEHATVRKSVNVVARAQWSWLVVACALELLSLMAFARTQRIVLRAAGVHASIPSMAATALAGNAISGSLPLIGSSAGFVFTYGRFRQVADDPAPAGWALLISGLISNLVWAFLIATGAIVSGNPAAILGGLLGSTGVVLLTVIVILAPQRPHWRKFSVQLAVRLIRISQRFRSRPVGDPESLAQKALETLSAYRMRPREWARCIRLSLVNWFASAACLVASILAVGATVPLSKVILIYCAGAAASSFNLTPGGLGVTEAVITSGLIASGVRPAEALGSALIFRLISFWLVTLVGLIIYFELRRRRDRRRTGITLEDRNFD
jgi:putative heme transporter